MEIGIAVAEFIAANAEKIFHAGKSLYGKVDEVVKLKLRLAYGEYLQNSENKYSKSKSFFVRDKSVDLYDYYVPTGLECARKVIDRPMFSNCLESSSRIIITGTGGTGKSILMKHLFLDCIRDKRYVPILIELRELNSQGLSLEEYIHISLDSHGFKMGVDFVKQAMLEGHFSFFFDGFDELEHSLRKNVIKVVRQFSTKYKECPIFMSSRPDDYFNGIDEFSIFKVLPLELEAASELVVKLPYDEDIKLSFVREMRRGLFREHESFLSNPLLLSIMLLTYGDNAEIPDKLSLFYNQAYETLFQRHDANKGGYLRARLADLDIQQFSRVFSLFCVLSLDKRSFKMSRTKCLDYIAKSRDNLRENFKAEDYLSDLLSAACLMIEDGLEVTFSHRSFQEYFVAKFIADTSPKLQEKLIEKYWHRLGTDSVISLLLEMKPDLVERVLIVPKLAGLFELLGVKDKVESHHVVRFIKNAYGTIRIARREFVYTAKYPLGFIDGSEKMPYEIAMFAMNSVAKHKGLGASYYENLGSQLYQKYKKSARFIAIDTVDIRVTDPVIIDIMNSETSLSLSYLRKVHNIYVDLKLKHEHQEADFDALLNAE